MSIYLDCAAAGRPEKEVVAFYSNAMQEDYANQEGIHGLAYQARKHLSMASAELLDAMIGTPDKYRVIWAASATECFRILAGFLKDKKVISSTLEHPALTANFQRETRLDLLVCDSCGQIILPATPLAPDAVIFHHVQSEIGALQDQQKLFAAFPGALKISDSVQSAGKLPLSENADIHIVSGIKFGSPGGAAMICSKDSPHTAKLERFSEQMRSSDYLLSRISVPLCRAMAFAARRCAKERELRLKEISELNTRLKSLLEKFTLRPLLPESAPQSPYIINFFLPGIQSAVIVRMLSEQGIFCSSGSACAAEAGGPSPALLAIGKSKNDAYSGLRISFDRFSTENDVNFLAFELEKALKNY